jgi:hypothetical protein
MPLLKDQSGKQLIETLTGPDEELLYEATHQINPDNTLETTREVWHDERLKATNQQLLKGVSLEAGAASDAIAAGKLAWDIIKEGKVVGQSADAMTSVLAKVDMDPMNYVNARDGSSGEYKWKVNDAFHLFGEINYVTIRLKTEGKYSATPRSTSPAPRGYYLPSVYVNILECRVNFPCSASGSANLANPSNIGREKEANAEVKIHAKLTAGWFAQHFGITIGFEATGTRGFRLLGRE